MYKHDYDKIKFPQDLRAVGDKVFHLYDNKIVEGRVCGVAVFSRNSVEVVPDVKPQYLLYITEKPSDSIYKWRPEEEVFSSREDLIKSL